ncbi:hypothetical protein O0F75_11255, partial [Staphylococcus pseudintermedius]|nr:hypothetical protein [Staphylococcus pseudintermedius]
MIKIYKNENDELECHVNYAGYDFKFQCIKNGFGATFEGSNSTEYREFESYIDEDGEILDNLQDVMYHIASVCNWRESFGEERDDLKRKLDDVVDLFNAHLHHKKAWSDNPY